MGEGEREMKEEDYPSDRKHWLPPIINKGDKVVCVNPGKHTEEIQEGQIYIVKKNFANLMLDIEEVSARIYLIERFQKI